MKWIAFMGLFGFLLCGSLSFLMPPPPNPLLPAEVSISSRIEVAPDAQAILKRSCYDCHSNETRWPVYSRAWPASALMYSDVQRARATMNFSDWPSLDDPRQARQAAGLLMASCAAMETGLMPRKQYLLMHPAAKISPQDAKVFCAWAAARATLIQKTLVQP
jgi:hypothetical protein